MTNELCLGLCNTRDVRHQIEVVAVFLERVRLGNALFSPDKQAAV